MKVTFARIEDLRRPRGWRRVDAWHDCEVRPAGAPGLRWHYRSGDWQDGGLSRPSLDDCLVLWRGRRSLVVWEPLLTKAPGPHLTSVWCCYLRTVIFYLAPAYRRSPWVKLFRTSSGWRHNGSPGHFEEWDQIETRLGEHDQVWFAGELFDRSSGGRVLWTSVAGERRRWWMRHRFRVAETAPSSAHQSRLAAVPA